MNTQENLFAGFEVEPKADNIFVAHYEQPPLDGLSVHEVLEAAAPVKDDSRTYNGNPTSLEAVVAQYGYNGVFEGMNTRILRAHRQAFPGAYERAFVSAQMIRACLEPHMHSPSMLGRSMEFPYDWSSIIEPADSVEELLEQIATFDSGSGVTPEEHLQTRILGIAFHSYGNAHEWVQIRSANFDGPLMLLVPGTSRGVRTLDIQPPQLAPKIAWQEVDGVRMPITNTAAGLETISETKQLMYQDGGVGLAIAAIKLGVNGKWPREHRFTEEELPVDRVRKGTIPMEAAQVPLLAQVSASTILNHPDFETLALNQ